MFKEGRKKGVNDYIAIKIEFYRIIKQNEIRKVVPYCSKYLSMEKIAVY